MKCQSFEVTKSVCETKKPLVGFLWVAITTSYAGADVHQGNPIDGDHN